MSANDYLVWAFVIALFAVAFCCGWIARGMLTAPRVRVTRQEEE